MNSLIQEKLHNACSNNHNHIVKHIMSSGLKNQIDLGYENGYAIRICIFNKNKELLDLFESFEKTKDLIKEQMNHFFGISCATGDIKKMVFIHSNYGHYLDHEEKDGWFFRAAYSNQKKEAIQFLICEMNLSKDSQNTKRTFLSESVTPEFKQYTLDLFEKHQFNKKIENDLKLKEKKTLKIKI